MRVNVYAEEMTDRVEIVKKGEFTGVRFWLELPVTYYRSVGNGSDGDVPYQMRGPFKHHPDDDDSAAVTFWGKKDLRFALAKAIALLDRELDETRRKPEQGKVE